MKIFTHNFNPASNSGPNKFTRQLFRTLSKNHNVEVTNNQNESDIEFCLIQQIKHKIKPTVLRLDGIYFNSEQDFKNQNTPIRFSYDNADAVIFQSNFNKNLTETWFGKHKNSHIIHNAPDVDLINKANPNYWDQKFGKDVEVWTCASSWRPHKRLSENIQYFLDYAPKDSIFVIAGSIGMDNAKSIIKNNKRIHLTGELDYFSLLSLYRRSTTFLHLAYLDHCPNVVVDAQAAGCKVICSSSGGTKEIVNNGIVIKEDVWDYKPLKLYHPPKMNFNNFYEVNNSKNNTSIVKCASKYYNIMLEVCNAKK